MFDAIFTIFLFLLIGTYTYILKQNDMLFHKYDAEIDSIINKNISVILEICTLLILPIISYLLYRQKEYILMLVFILVLFEHINQIIFCYRQNNNLNLITIIINIVFMIYAYYKKCYWIIPVFLIGISIHSISHYYNKSLYSNVCI